MQVYERDMMRMSMEYGFTPSLPMMPLAMVSTPMESVANRMMTPRIGADP